MVVEHGVDERGTDHRPIVTTPSTGSAGGRLAVAAALNPTDIPPAAGIGDIAELGDIDVNQRPWVSMLVATKRLTGGPVDVAEPVDRQRTNTA
ncbi:hypothetical protein GCM10022140_04510 [Rhodococcus aetherivorans]